MNEFTIRSNGNAYTIVNSKTLQDWSFTVEYLKKSDMGIVASNLVNPSKDLHWAAITKMQALVWFHNWIKENKPEELI